MGSFRSRILFVALAATVAVALLIAPGVAAKREIGDSRVIARMPPTPGYPEGVAVQGSTVYITTAARFGTSLLPPPGPPEVQSFEIKTGRLARRIAIADISGNREHGLSGVAFDASGLLYVLSTQWGIVRFNPETAPAAIDLNSIQHREQFLYSKAFPDLLPCVAAPAPCSPTLTNAPSLPNDHAFAPDGSAYITDSLQATIWRVPSGGGDPSIWFQDERLDGGFGPNGIRIDAARRLLYFAVSTDRTAHGRIFRLPISQPSSSTLEVFHTYTGAEVPDNLAFGRSGRLYVALAGTNQLQVLLPSGAELTRFSGPARSPEGDVVYDMPSGVAVNEGSVLVNNHSEILGIPERFVVFDVYVDDRAEPLVRPEIA